MRLVTLACAFIIGWSSMAAGQNKLGHNITIEYKPDTIQELLIGYHFGNKQYVLDTLDRSENGRFAFKGTDTLQKGIYLVIVPPFNSYHEIMIDDDQEFSVTINTPKNRVDVKGSSENKLFRGHVQTMTDFYDRTEELKAQVMPDTAAIAQVQQERKAYELKLIQDYPESLTAAMVKSNMPLEEPEFEGGEAEVQEKRWRWYKAHFFDQVDLTDERLVRSPILQPRLDYYFDKLVVPHPDSIIVEVDRIMAKMAGHEQSFKFGLSHLFNKYAKSDIVGMDAVTVHMIDTYYATPEVDWIDEKKRRELKREARKKRPLLLGKVAPDFVGYKRDSSEVRLHDISSDYVVLYFWAWDCGHCKKSMPDMIKFYNEYKSKGVEILAACTKTRENADQCWDMVDERNMDIWINVNDPELKSRYVLSYDITSTPQIYILDKDKKILMKKIGSKKLPEIMDRILQMNPSSSVK